MTAPAEVVEARVVEEVARAIHGADRSYSGPWEDVPPRAQQDYLRMAVAGYRAAQDGGAEEAVRRVETLADEWAQDQEADYRAGIGGTINKLAASRRIRAALAPQAGEAGQ